MTVPVFSGRSLTCQFGNLAALKNLNFEIHAGEKVGLVGSSGAGKSTLLNILNGGLIPSDGEILVWGECLSHLSGQRRRTIQRQIGTIYQHFQLVESLAVIHNVKAGYLGYWSFGQALLSLVFPELPFKGSSQDIQRVKSALKQVGIADKLYARTGDLSGGQKQRVALARILVQNPEVILADEPIASLDPQLSQEMMDLLATLCDRHGKTLVISLHSLKFARSHCDRLIGLKQGCIVFDCPAPEVTDAQLTHLYSESPIY